VRFGACVTQVETPARRRGHFNRSSLFRQVRQENCPSRKRHYHPATSPLINYDCPEQACRLLPQFFRCSAAATRFFAAAADMMPRPAAPLIAAHPRHASAAAFNATFEASRLRTQRPSPRRGEGRVNAPRCEVAMPRAAIDASPPLCDADDMPSHVPPDGNATFHCSPAAAVVICASTPCSTACYPQQACPAHLQRVVARYVMRACAAK